MNQYFKAYYHNPTGSGLEFVYCPKCRTDLDKRTIDGLPRMYCPGCGFIQYLNPLPGISVMIEKNSKILIGKRSSQSVQSHKWCLPCGFIEHHENYLDAAHREVYEETGLRITITSLVNVFSNHLSPVLHSIVPVLTAEIISGNLKPGDDIVDLKWLSADDPFPDMAFDADQFIIGKYFENNLVRIPIDPRYQLASTSSP